MSTYEYLPTPPPTSDEGRALSPDVASPVVGSGSATLGAFPGVAIRLDHLARRCGHYEPGSPVNGGYGCRHPEQSERRNDLDGRPHGCCFSFSCPVAYSMSAESDEDVAIMSEQHPDVSEIQDGVWMLWDEVPDALTPTTPASSDSARGFGFDLSAHLYGRKP